MELRRKIILISLLNAAFFPLVAQTYIGGFIGIDLSEIKEPENIWHYEILDKAYKNKSLMFGIEVQHNLNKTIYVALQISGTQKSLKTHDAGFNPLIGISFYKYSNSILIGYTILNNFQLAAGPQLYFIPAINSFGNNGFQGSEKVNKTVASIKISSSYLFRRYFISLSFIKGIDYINIFNKSENYYEYMRPINSIELCLGYKFKLFGQSINSKSINCPSFNAAKKN